MKSLLIFCILVICLVPNTECLQQAYRAFIPSSKLDWFNKVLARKNDVDIWLSPRTLTASMLKKIAQNGTSATDFLEKYKYYAEFQIKIDGNTDKIKEAFEKNNVRCELMISDLDDHFNSIYKREKRDDDEKPAPTLKQLSQKVINKYASTFDVINWMLSFAKANKKLVKLNRIGRSFVGRPIIALSITAPNKKQSKPLFLFDAGIHAREWITVATATYMIDKLVKDYKNDDPVVKKLLNNFEIHFIPVANPDGYEFSRSAPTNRLWRKNMRFTRLHSSEHACYGVDLNRNFDHKWMVAGASANPCNEIYAGPFPASEPETVALSSYILSKKTRWLSYISLHSYGADWLAAYSYSKTHIASNFQDTCYRARSAIDKINNKYDADYEFGSASHLLYEASGASEDWARAIGGINHTFTVELKPTVSNAGRSGFEMAEKKLPEASLEAYESFVEFMRTFLPGYKYKQSVISKCKKQLNDMMMTVESYSREQTEQENEYDF